MNWNKPISRRTALMTTASLPLLGAGLPGIRAAEAAGAACSGATAPSKPEPVALAGPALLEAYMKMRARTDGRVAPSWMDASTYAFIEGETFPLYRLFAATWYQYKRVSPDRYEGAAVEVAFYLDIETGEPLETLQMPRKGHVVTVPRYRAGPTKTSMELHSATEQPFGMAKEGGAFFRAGVARSRTDVGHPTRDGKVFNVTDHHETRVIPDAPNAPGFFYSEWIIRRAAWDAVMDPRRASAPTEVVYSSVAAYRPWMKMEGVPGHTIQSGLGATVERVEDFPAGILELCRKYHPDLVEQPEKVFAAASA
ncbi:MAG: DUF1838 family protein [Steroidobacteraceae bacterium]|nr:DUF1838 family protein [Steroidobacteraceae bacterium]MCC7199135.1 DUF1838 family protein [Gammaproteobacteria bacterium]